MDRESGVIGINRLAAIYQRLLTIDRFNTTPRVVNERIASHMYIVALLCMAIGRNMSIDMSKTLQMVMIHDMDESYCFPPGTKVLVYREGNKDWLDYVDIEKVGVGDRVLSYNEATANMEIKEVICVGSRFSEEMAVIKFPDGNDLRCTSDHHIYIIDRGWVMASDLCIGDICIKEKYPNTVKIEVLGVHRWHEKKKVYNVCIKDNLNYFAQGILVHNSGDITANLKRFHPEVGRALAEASDEFLGIILGDIPCAEEWHDLWREYKERKSDEAKLVKVADCVAQVIAMSIEARMGNKFAHVPACNAMYALREHTIDENIIRECEDILSSVGIDSSSRNRFEQWEM